MLFNSLQYAAFLPAVLIAYWAVPCRWRVNLLLVASYLFYATWSVPYAGLIFALVIVNYALGLWIGRARRARGWILCLGIVVDLGVLGFFKLWNYVSLTAAYVIQHGPDRNWMPLTIDLVAPLGISFFTFEFIHYLVDIYRGRSPVHDFSAFHVFASFFPTQIAGPIKRFEQFVPQLTQIARFDADLAREGAWLVGRGLAKKMLLADTVAPIVNAGFGAGASFRLGTTEAWISALAFALQIYFDFSGYTDIARGSSRLLGFRIPINFDAPYLATSVADFWHRWHISLSTWLRDYVYIPLGGSRHGLPETLRNLFLTMLLGGIWHGAGGHFIVWGAFWGVVLVLHRLWSATQLASAVRVHAVAGWLLSQLVVLTGWVLFRADSMPTALYMLRTMVDLQPARGVLDQRAGLFVVSLATALVATQLAARLGWSISLPRGLQPVALGAGLAVGAVLLALAAPPEAQRFIYFQF